MGRLGTVEKALFFLTTDGSTETPSDQLAAPRRARSEVSAEGSPTDTSRWRGRPHRPGPRVMALYLPMPKASLKNVMGDGVPDRVTTSMIERGCCGSVASLIRVSARSAREVTRPGRRRGATS